MINLNLERIKAIERDISHMSFKYKIVIQEIIFDLGNIP